MRRLRDGGGRRCGCGCRRGRRCQCVRVTVRPAVRGPASLRVPRRATGLMWGQANGLGVRFRAVSSEEVVHEILEVVGFVAAAGQRADAQQARHLSRTDRRIILVARGHRFTGRGLLPLLAPPLRARPWHPRRSASTSAVRTWALGRHGPQG